MVPTPEMLTDKGPIYTITSTAVKKPSDLKSLCMFTNVLEVQETAYRRVGATKSKRKAIKFVNTPWALKKKVKVKFKNQ